MSSLRWLVTCATGRRGLRYAIRGRVAAKRITAQIRRVVRKPCFPKRYCNNRGIITPPRPVPACHRVSCRVKARESLPLRGEQDPTKVDE
jgi:hypothetical protein